MNSLKLCLPACHFWRSIRPLLCDQKTFPRDGVIKHRIMNARENTNCLVWCALGHSHRNWPLASTHCSRDFRWLLDRSVIPRRRCLSRCQHRTFADEIDGVPWLETDFLQAQKWSGRNDSAAKKTRPYETFRLLQMMSERLGIGVFAAETRRNVSMKFVIRKAARFEPGL